MDAFGDTGARLRPFPLDGNMQAFIDQEEQDIDAASDAEDFDEITRLTEQALLNPRLPFPSVVRYETLLACVPGRNPWTHIKNAEHVLGVIDEYLEMEEHPEPINLDFVERYRAMIEKLKEDIRTVGDWSEESEIDNVSDKHKPKKRGMEYDREEEERYVKKSKFVEDEIPSPEHPFASTEYDVDIDMSTDAGTHAGIKMTPGDVCYSKPETHDRTSVKNSKSVENGAMALGNPVDAIDIDNTPHRPPSVNRTQLEACERTSLQTTAHQGEDHIGTGDNTHSHSGIKRPASKPFTGQEFKRASNAGYTSVPVGILPKHLTGSNMHHTPAVAERPTAVAEEEGKQDNHAQGTKRPASESSTSPATKRPSSAGDNSPANDTLSKHLTGPKAPATHPLAEHLTAVAEEKENKPDKPDKPDEQRDNTVTISVARALKLYTLEKENEMLKERVRCLEAENERTNTL